MVLEKRWLVASVLINNITDVFVKRVVSELVEINDERFRSYADMKIKFVNPSDRIISKFRF